MKLMLKTALPTISRGARLPWLEEPAALWEILPRLGAMERVHVVAIGRGLSIAKWTPLGRFEPVVARGRRVLRDAVSGVTIDPAGVERVRSGGQEFGQGPALEFSFARHGGTLSIQAAPGYRGTGHFKDVAAGFGSFERRSRPSKSQDAWLDEWPLEGPREAVSGEAQAILREAMEERGWIRARIAPPDLAVEARLRGFYHDFDSSIIKVTDRGQETVVYADLASARVMVERAGNEAAILGG